MSSDEEMTRPISGAGTSSSNLDSDSAVKKHLLSAIQDDNILLENPSLRFSKRSSNLREKRSTSSDKTDVAVEDDIFDDDET